MFPHQLLHQGSPQSYITCPQYFLRTSAEITVGLWCILPSAGNIQTESSPFSSFSAFHTGGGHISHHHSEPGMNISASVESHCFPMSCPWFTCWDLPTMPLTRLEVKGKENTLFPHHRDIGFPKKTEDSSDSTVDVNSKQKPRALPKKPAWK